MAGAVVEITVQRPASRLRRFALAGPAGLGQDLPYPVERKRSGDHAEADVAAEAEAGDLQHATLAQ